MFFVIIILLALLGGLGIYSFLSRNPSEELKKAYNDHLVAMKNRVDALQAVVKCCDEEIAAKDAYIVFLKKRLTSHEKLTDSSDSLIQLQDERIKSLTATNTELLAAIECGRQLEAVRKKQIAAYEEERAHLKQILARLAPQKSTPSN